MSWATNHKQRWVHYYHGETSICRLHSRNATNLEVNVEPERIDLCPKCNDILCGANTLADAIRRTTMEMARLGKQSHLVATGPDWAVHNWHKAIAQNGRLLTKQLAAAVKDLEPNHAKQFAY